MHLAVFETSSRYGDIDYEFDYVTSCVTLTPEGRVPSGKKYNVQIICSVEIAPICDVIIFVFQPGMYFNATLASHVFVYVHNVNQVCTMNSDHKIYIKFLHIYRYLCLMENQYLVVIPQL